MAEKERAYSYDDLHGMTVAQLRDVARGIEHEAVQGYTQLHKEELLLALCRALGIEAHEHHDVTGVNKAAIKAQIRQLKMQRDQALEARDRRQLKAIRRRIHHLKHRLRRAMV